MEQVPAEIAVNLNLQYENVNSAIVELSPDQYSHVSGGDVGSGLITIPK